jgi:hypothetical protein
MLSANLCHLRPHRVKYVSQHDDKIRLIVRIRAIVPSFNKICQIKMLTGAAAGAPLRVVLNANIFKDLGLISQCETGAM